MSDDTAVALQALLDKQAIAEVMMRYCRALDHCDVAMLRSVFHPDSVHHHFFRGPSSLADAASSGAEPPDFVAFAMQVLATHTRTHHQLGNLFVELEPCGTVAFTEAYFTAYHRQRAKGDPLAPPQAWDTEMDVWVGGRYLDRMEKRAGEWRITHRTGTTDWQRIEPPSSTGFLDLSDQESMRQDTSDLVYRRREVYR